METKLFYTLSTGNNVSGQEPPTDYEVLLAQLDTLRELVETQRQAEARLVAERDEARETIALRDGQIAGLRAELDELRRGVQTWKL